MTQDNELGLIFKISADPSKANAEIEQVQAKVGQLADSAVAANEAVSQSAISANATLQAMRQTVAASLAQQGASAEEAAQVYKQLGISGEQAAAEIAAAFPAATEAVEGAAVAADSSAASIDRMTGAMAYGTVRAAAFAGNLGPVGYVLGTVGRVSETLAPILSELFPIAMIAIAVDMMNRWASSIEQADEKLLQERIRVEDLSLSMTELAQSTQLENLKLQDQIDKLDGVPTPNALDESILQTTIDAEKLLSKMSQLGMQADKTLNQVEPGLLHAVASEFYRAVPAAMAFMGGMPLSQASAWQMATAHQHAGIEAIKDRIMEASGAAQEMAEKLSTSGLKGKAAFEAEQASLKRLGATFSGLSGEIQSLSQQYGLNKEQLYAVRAAVIAYEEAAKDAIEEATKGQLEYELAQRHRRAEEERAAEQARKRADEHRRAAARALEAAQRAAERARKAAEREDEAIGKAAEATVDKAIERAHRKAAGEARQREAMSRRTQQEWNAGAMPTAEHAMGASAALMAANPQLDVGNVARQAATHIDAETRAVWNLQAAMLGLSPVMDEVAQKHQFAAQLEDRFAEAMGKNIAMAIVYGSSISAAVEKALKATVASIAAEAMVRAIYATGLGFFDLAIGDYAAAAQAFEAAAIFGAVGAAAAAISHAIPGGAGAHAPSGAGATGSGAGRRSSAGGSGTINSPMAPGARGPMMPSGSPTILIAGPEEWTHWTMAQINRQVTENGATLHASHTQRPAPVGH